MSLNVQPLIGHVRSKNHTFFLAVGVWQVNAPSTSTVELILTCLYIYFSNFAPDIWYFSIHFMSSRFFQLIQYNVYNDIFRWTLKTGLINLFKGPLMSVQASQNYVNRMWENLLLAFIGEAGVKLWRHRCKKTWTYRWCVLFQSRYQHV